MLRFLPCPECQDERGFEQPPCNNGHGMECPEWACVDCGVALLVAEVIPAAGTRMVGVAPPDGRNQQAA